MRDPREGGLDRAMALSLSAVVSAGCLRFFVPWALTVLAEAIDITSAGAPACIKKLSNRNKRKDTIITNPKAKQRGSYRISLGVARPGLGQNQHHWCAHLSFFGREEQWKKQVGVFLKKWGTWWGRSEGWVERKLREKSERRNEMREKRSEWGFSSREEAEREEWNDDCFVRPTYCWKSGGFVIWWLIGHYYGALTSVVYCAVVHSSTE